MADSPLPKRKRLPSKRLLESQETAAGFGKGRGRGAKSTPVQAAARGRGRGRGRGRSLSVPRTGDDDDYDLDVILGERRRKIQTMVNQLSPEKAKRLLCEAIETDPSLLSTLGSEGDPPPASTSLPPPDTTPRWCVCHNCREMPTVAERRCCGRLPTDCIAESRDMQIVALDPLVLYVHRMYRQDVMALRRVFQGDIQRQNRHAAYRSLVLWKWGRLISGDRRVILSCCVWKIRSRFPDQHGHYTGFIPGRLG